MADRSVALTKLYELILWMTPLTEKFPKTLRSTLANRIQNELLDILRCLIEARFSRRGQDSLDRANLGIDYLRLLIRLGKDLRALSLSQYAHAQKLLDEVGRLVGGWRRALGGRSVRSAAGMEGRRDGESSGPTPFPGDVAPR